MAVKAADQISITDMTDVKSFFRYYLLQSSTLSVPSKPNTNPPPSTWTKTEPGYTAGSTNSLYFTDLTIYSNNTFSYSDVSLSSSYEAAKTAYNKAVEAAKTATNYIDYTSANGLQVGDKTDGSWKGFRTQITSSVFNILNEAGGTLASYGAKLIELGKNAVDAVIEFCGGKGKIYVRADSRVDTVTISSEAVSMSARTKDAEKGYSVSSLNSRFSLAPKQLSADVEAIVDVLGENSQVSLNTSARDGDSSATSYLNMISKLGGSLIDMDADTITIGGNVYFGSNSDAINIASGRITLPNGKGLRSLDSNGAARALIWLSTANALMVGNGTADTAHSGDTYVNAMNGGVKLRCKASTVELIPYNGANENSYFRPTVTNVVGLGSASYRWYRLYQYVETISTSDEREKHDIAEIKDGDVLEMLFDSLIPKTYQLNGEKEDKTHIGFIAQDVSKSLEEIGLHESGFGLINHEYWTDEETGEEKDEYGLAYPEFIALNTHMIQKLRKENEKLKERLEKIETILNITN